MTTQPQQPTIKDQKLFLAWFAEQYDVGVPDSYLFDVCSAYLQGLLDSCGADDNRGNLMQCLSVMRSAGVMVRVLKQYQVKVDE